MRRYRKKLEELTDKRRYSFRGILTYTGYKDSSKYRYTESYYVPTFMLRNVEYWDEENNSWQFVADHLWMNYTKQFKYYYPLLKDDVIYFDGRIKKYRYKDGHNIRINMPTKIKVERNAEIIDKTCTDVLEDWELVEIIMKNNEDYYHARDKIDGLYYIENYYYIVNNIGPVEVLVKLDGKWTSKEQYKNRYQSREEVVALFKRNQNPTVQITMYNQDENNIFHKKPKKDGSVIVSYEELKNAVFMTSIGAPY